MGAAKADLGGEDFSHQSLRVHEYVVSNLENEFQDEADDDSLWTPSDTQLLALVFIVSMAASFAIAGIYLVYKNEKGDEA
jgi:hypothetical protein